MARQVLSLIGCNATVLNTVGPGMNAFLTRVNKDANPIKTIYVPFSIADPCVFQGLLLLSARSYSKSSGDDSFHATALACKAECFRLVNIAMQDLRRAISDATIATVLMLTVEAVRLSGGTGDMT
jgi:Fungal specific transcription factor domain